MSSLGSDIGVILYLGIVLLCGIETKQPAMFHDLA